MATYSTIEELNSTLQLCNTCSTEKYAKDFTKKYDKIREKYYVNNTCAKCTYLNNQDKYKAKAIAYAHVQRDKEINTIEGRASLLRNRAKQRAKKANIEFKLSKSIIIDKLNKGICEVTSIPIILGELDINPYAPSIDRIDNSKGYTDDNIQITCMIYNYCKNEFTDEQVYNFITQVKYADRGI